MTVNIENVLSSRETVIWRDWPDKPDQLDNWLGFSILAYVLARTAIESATRGWANNDTSMLFCSVIPIASILACMAIAAVWSFFRGAVDNPTVVTDRRILLASGGGEVTSIMLGDVTSVQLVDGFSGLQVAIGRKSDGKQTLLSTGHVEEFAGAIASAIGHSAPGYIGRLRHLYSFSRFWGFVISYEVIKSRPEFMERQIEGVLEVLPIGWIGLLALTFAMFFIYWWFIWWLGTHLVAIAAIVLMPRYASVEEAADWLRMETQFMVIPTFGWKSRPYAWLGRWVYGRDLRIAGSGST